MGLKCLARLVIVTDCHFWDSPLRNRTDYVNECVKIYVFIKKRVEELRKDYPNDKIYIIFLGDVFHRSFKLDDTLVIWVQEFLILRSMCNGIFFVVGNHETSFSAKNPFWNLVNSIESKKLSHARVFAKGRLGPARILDHFDIGEHRLHFVHHGCGIDNVGDGRNFLFAHDYWLNNELFNSLENLGGVKLQKKYMRYNTITENSIISKFDECYFGHMHMLVGDHDIYWDDVSDKRTGLHHLGSLGLTNKLEVKQTKRERNIPTLVLYSNGTYEHQDYKILLPDSKDVLDEEEVIKNEKAYVRSKEKKQLIEKYLLGGTDPVKYIEEEIVGDIEMYEIFDCLQRGAMPEWLTKVL